MALPEKLDVFVIPMQKQTVMLPADAIAEIIPYEPLQRVEDPPEWLLGLLGWRGVQLPVVSFEMLTVERASFSLVSVASASLVIMRGTTDQESLPFYALVAQTFPRSREINQEMLIDTGEPLQHTELAKVRFENDVLSVPNLDYIEAALLNALIQ
ncbi:MAG: chemotaxis protein CheW [Proteobacteria bacterium]|nr:chemotaxis protein CheW [Pseudomonadota bacterium]